LVDNDGRGGSRGIIGGGKARGNDKLAANNYVNIVGRSCNNRPILVAENGGRGDVVGSQKGGIGGGNFGGGGGGSCTMVKAH